MTTVLDKPATTPPAPAPPARSGVNRTLAWVGGSLGLAAMIWSSLTLVSLIAREESSGSATYAAAPVVELVADGRVEVTGAQTDEVSVERSARFAFSDPSYSAQVRGDRLVVEHRCAWRWVLQCSTDLTVTVPQGTALIVRTTDGSIRAEGVLGNAELRSDNGTIVARSLGGDLRVDASNGSVEVSDVVGSVKAWSSNGRIEVRGAASADARTSNGDVDVLDVDGAVVASSSNGRVEVAQARSDITATSDNGSVKVYGTGLPVALEIRSSNGSETIEAPTDPGADVRVTIRSSNGDVSYLSPIR